ncbi:hypothetical protein [Kaarinaea lacus]
MNAITYLKSVNNQSKSPATNTKIAPLTRLQTGYRYHVNCQDYARLNATHGVIGDYRISKQTGKILSITPPTPGASMTLPMSACYFWDTSTDLSKLEGQLIQNNNNSDDNQLLSMKDCQVATSRLILNGTSLDGPELIFENGITSLKLLPRFDFTFITESHAAHLGVVNLVKAHRILKLEDDKEILLLDTGIDDSPVLFLENADDDQPVKPIAALQEAGTTHQNSCTFIISQTIPEKIDIANIATVTVLEQYFSYFMQKIDASDDESIWTPVYAPITWGWSIRVGRRTDGEWGILRRKLILPTTGNDGWCMPVWSNNTISCSVFPEQL